MEKGKKRENVVKQQQLEGQLFSSLFPLSSPPCFNCICYSIALEWQVLMYLANVSFKCISPNELQCELICQLGGNSQSPQYHPLPSYPLPLNAEPVCQSVIKCVVRLLLRVFIASCRAQMKQIQRWSHRYSYRYIYSDSCRYRYRHTVPVAATASAAASHAAH